MNVEKIYFSTLAKFPSNIRFFILLIVNWSFQGRIHINRVEQIIRTSIELILIAIIFYTLHYTVSFGIGIGIGIAFFLSHSLNWIFTTNIWSTQIRKHGRIQYKSKKFMQFLMLLRQSVQNDKSIYGAAIYGSMSTGKFNEDSDIDIKLYRNDGFWNLIKSYLFLFSIRTKSNIHMIPLDIYVIDKISDYHLKEEEIPIIIHDPDYLFNDFYDKVDRFKKSDEVIKNGMKN